MSDIERARVLVASVAEDIGLAEWRRMDHDVQCLVALAAAGLALRGALDRALGENSLAPLLLSRRAGEDYDAALRTAVGDPPP